MKWCHGGSGGVFVVKFPSGAICVKGSDSSTGELFATRLAAALGVPAAKARLVHPDDAELPVIRRALLEVEAAESDRVQASLLKRKASLTLVEYVDGFVMMGMPAHQHLKNDDGSSGLCFELGRLMAFDMLINNFDRLPLVWSNEGNLGNIMLGSHQGPVLGIDQCVQPILHPAGLEAYLARVGQIVEDACGGGAPNKAFTAVKTAIYNNTAVELDDAQFTGLREGCLCLLSQVAKLVDSGGLETTLQTIVEDFEVRSRHAPATKRDSQSLLPVFCELVRNVAAVANARLLHLHLSAEREGLWYDL